MSHPKLKRIMVTGGCGFVGSVVVDKLLAKGYDVVVADDLSNPQSSVKPGYEFFHIDIGNLEDARKAFEGVDCCIALAAKRGAIGYVHRNPTEFLVEHSRVYNGTFKAAVEANVERLVFISSSMIYENSKKFPSQEADVLGMPIPIPVSVFGFSKLMGEWYCRTFHEQFGLPYTIIRPSNIYGPNERPGAKIGDTHVIPELFRKIQTGQYPLELLGNGLQSRSFIHVTDITEGIVMALESKAAENEDFNMGGAEEVKIIELAEMIWNLCGREEPFRIKQVEGFPQDVQRQFLDTAKARELLGWQPGVSFEQGLKEVVEWLLTS